MHTDTLTNTHTHTLTDMLCMEYKYPLSRSRHFKKVTSSHSTHFNVILTSHNLTVWGPANIHNTCHNHMVTYTHHRHLRPATNPATPAWPRSRGWEGEAEKRPYPTCLVCIGKTNRTCIHSSHWFTQGINCFILSNKPEGIIPGWC